MRKQTPACFEAETFHPFWKKDQETGNSRTSQDGLAKKNVRWVNLSHFSFIADKIPKTTFGHHGRDGMQKRRNCYAPKWQFKPNFYHLLRRFWSFSLVVGISAKEVRRTGFSFRNFPHSRRLGFVARSMTLFPLFLLLLGKKALGVWDFPSQPTSWKEADSLKVGSFFKMFTLLGKKASGLVGGGKTTSEKFSTQPKSLPNWLLVFYTRRKVECLSTSTFNLNPAYIAETLPASADWLWHVILWLFGVCLRSIPDSCSEIFTL